MTEDDTFAALKKTPFDAIRAPVLHFQGPLAEFEELLRSHGWTMQEFVDAANGSIPGRVWP